MLNKVRIQSFKTYSCIFSSQTFESLTAIMTKEFFNHDILYKNIQKIRNYLFYHKQILYKFLVKIHITHR